MVETLNIAVLGAPGVGKTAIIHQFLYNDFSDVYFPTRSKTISRPSVILNDTMYDLKVMDVPPLPSFPTSSSQEWMDSRSRGVRNANAYVLVYDIGCLESFEYVKMIRQQIVDNRTGNLNEAPIIVVGNKRDQQKQRFTPRRTVSVLVKKTWKCGYIECSAKYNWHIMLLFKELLSTAVARSCKHNHSSMRIQGALHRNRCSLM
ncbi:ras-like protein family member 10A [Latimeria chalumnae]|uniref:RAS like family 10 member A n=1 Tax=Latimeria chalumnae TaxID=7897 RepID=H3A9T3_LATCH|nr:PREDICTED: ras-like protein family member 10A [Latimeria chalumnae]|eukprot:XP_006009014.1 PREDICTED: ras-like protein family member 10A [Latimeria chalumnae]